MSAVRLLPSTLLLALLPTIAAAEPAATPLNPLAGLDETTLRGFVERPLFEPSRHPPVPPAPAVAFVPPPLPPPAPVVEPPPMLRVLGVVEGAHSLAAIVRRADTGKTETLRPGDHLGSWTVAVQPTGMQVRDGNRVFDYVMFKGAQTGPEPAAPVPPPGAVSAAREVLTVPYR